MSNSNELNDLSIMTAAIQIVSSIFKKQNGHDISKGMLVESVQSILYKVQTLREIAIEEIEKLNNQKISIEDYNILSKILLELACFEKQNENSPEYSLIKNSSFKELLKNILENNNFNLDLESFPSLNSFDDQNVNKLLFINLKLYSQIYYNFITTQQVQSTDINLIQDIISSHCKDISIELYTLFEKNQNNNLITEIVEAMVTVYLICLQEAFMIKKEIENDGNEEEPISIQEDYNDSLVNFADRILDKQKINKEENWTDFFENIYENFQFKKNNIFIRINELAKVMKLANHESN